MKKIVVIGSVNVDTTLYVNEFPSEGETITGEHLEIDVGGKGLNQAIAIKKAKGDVLFISAIGNDENANMIIEATKKYELESSLYKAPINTGTAYIVVDKNSKNKITVIPGSNNHVKDYTINKSLIEASDIIVLQNEIPMLTNEYILKNYKDKVIVYNPSPLKPLKSELYSSISYLIVNEHEVVYFGKDKDIIKSAKALVNKGIKNVIVTLGEHGSVLFNKNEEIKVDAVKVNAIDTVAAGDTYLGYFVTGLSKGLSNKEAMELASKASAITVTHKGAVISIPTIDEIK